MIKDLIYLGDQLDLLGLEWEATQVDQILEKIAKSHYNSPRVGGKRWSIKQKRGIDCSNPRGFSQKQYCKRKRRGGEYKS